MRTACVGCWSLRRPARWPLPAARPQGDGLTATPISVPWPRWQSRGRAGTPRRGWRAELAPIEPAACRLSARQPARRLLLRRRPGRRGAAQRRLSRHQRPAGRPARGAGARPTGARRRRSGVGVERRACSAVAAAPAMPAERRRQRAALPRPRLQRHVAARRLELQRRPRAGGAEPGQRLRLGARCTAARRALDDLLRDLRLSPVLQLGVSYAF